METSLAIQHQLSEEKWGKFKEDMKNLEEMSKKIKNLLIIDYEAIFPEILLISKNQFLSNIKKGVYSNLEDLYTNNIKNDPKLKSLIDDNLKNIDEKYEINYNLIKIEWDNFNENKNDKNYLCNYRKHCFNDTEYATHNCKDNDSKFIVISIKNIESNKNEFVICSNCQKVYKSSFFLCKCFHCDTEYYSQKLPEDQNTDLFLATWKEYHCPQLINNKMSCIKCKSPFYLNMKTGMLNCSNKNCQFISKPKRILWTCNNCKKDFTSEAIVYNPLDVEIIQKAIKQTLLLKHRAHPNKMPCCRLNIFFTEFYHKKTCKGILYLGEINDELIIVCEKCQAINYYSRFIWTCPKCQTKFRTKKKERTQSNYSNHKSEDLSCDKSISLKTDNKEEKNNNQCENDKIEINKKEIDKKENKDDYDNKNNYLTINGNDNDQRMEIKDKDKEEDKEEDKEDDIVKVIRKNSIKAVVNSPLRKRNKAYQSFRLKRPNKFDVESAKQFNCVSIDTKDKTKINSFCDKENENQRKSMYFSRKFKSGLAEFKIGENEKEKINKEKEDDKNEVKQKDKVEDNLNDLNHKNEHNVMHKSIEFKKNYNTIEEKSYFRNRFKFIKDKNEKVDKFGNNNVEDNNMKDKEPHNKVKDRNKSENESKLIRVNTTDESQLIGKNYIQYRKSKFHKKEEETLDENKDKDNDIKNESDNKENEKEKENKPKKRGAFSKYLFLRGSNHKLGGSAKNNFLSENFLRRANLKVPDYSVLKEKDNKKENIRKSSSSSASFSDKNENDKEELKDGNVNNFKSKEKDKVRNNNIIKNIKENSKKSTKVDSKESIKVSSKKEIEKGKENKEEVKEKYEEKEEEEDNFEDDEENTEGIEVDNNNNNDDTNSKSNTQYIPGISEHLLSHITKRINHILNNTNISQFNLEDYSVYRKLGEGSYGIIHCIIHEKTKEKFALKKIIAHSLKKISEFTKEFELVHICHHPNILKIYGLNINILDQSTYSLQVLMEKAERDWDKDIKRRLQERKYYTEDELVSIMKQLTSALLFMKEKLNITHRDIKPQNVLIFNDGVFKLADFGEAKEIKIKKNLNTLRGTELYMSPALYNGLKVNQDDVAHDPFKSDLFSLGFCLVYASTFNFNLLYELRNINNDEIIRKKIREELKDNYSEKFIWILTKMVELEEKNRFDFKELADEIEKNYGK